jgi:CheY-like chemotaxis protein
MSIQRLKIFVVDDDPVARMVAIQDLTDPSHEFVELESGEDCIAALDQEPDLILMDVAMSGLTGIETCRIIRESGNLCPVIFISAHDNLNFRLDAYDAGARDFVVKPYVAGELRQKVKVAEIELQRQAALSEQINQARQVAFTAMSSMSETAIVHESLRNSFAAHTPQELATSLLNALEQFGLRGFLEIRHSKDTAVYFSHHGACTPLEKSILKHAQSMDRIFQFRSRLIINYPRLSVLITNLPLEDDDRVGRLRDHLAILAQGCDARLIAMESESIRDIQAAGIVKIAKQLAEVLAEVEQTQKEHRISALKIGSTYLDELERTFMHQGLLEAHERELATLAKRSVENFTGLLDEGNSAAERLGQVTKTLRNLMHLDEK